MNNSYVMSLCRKEVFNKTGAGIGWGMYLRAWSWWMDIPIDVEERVC